MTGGEQQDGTGWVPEFPGQRPPFTPGHEVTLRHGAYSPRRYEPLAAELVDLILDDPATSYLRSERWRASLWAWARAEARVQLLTEYLVDLAGEDLIPDPADDRVRAASLELHRAETRATTGRTRLGLDPLSAARLGKDVAQGAAANADVARVMAELHRLEQAGQLPPGVQTPASADPAPPPGAGEHPTQTEPGAGPGTPNRSPSDG